MQAVEDGPEQDLVRCQDKSSESVLQLLDGARGPEAVAPENHGFGTVTHVLRDPLHDHGGLDLVRVVGKFSQACVEDLKSLTMEVGRAELVLLGAEPRRVNEADPLDSVQPQGRYR